MAIELTGSIAPKTGADFNTVVSADHIDFSSSHTGGTTTGGLGSLLSSGVSTTELTDANGYLVVVDTNGNTTLRTRTDAGGATKLNDLSTGDGAATLATSSGGITLSTDIAGDNNLVSGFVLSEAGHVTKIGQDTPATGAPLKWDGSKWAPGTDIDTGVLASDDTTFTGDNTFNNEISADGGIRVDDNFTVDGSDGAVTTNKKVTISNSADEVAFVVNSDKFTIKGNDGDTVIKGALNVQGNTSLASLSGLSTFSFKNSSDESVSVLQPAALGSGQSATFTLPAKGGSLIGTNGAGNITLTDTEVFEFKYGSNGGNDYGFDFKDSNNKRLAHFGADNISFYNVSTDANNQGTAQFTYVPTANTLSITSDTTISGATTINNTFTVGNNKLTVASATGNTSTAGTLDVANSADSTVFSVNTNKFTVNGSNGNTSVAGNLTIDGVTSANGGLTTLNSTDVSTDNFYFTVNADATAATQSAYAGLKVDLTATDATGIVYSNVTDEWQNHGWAVMPQQAPGDGGSSDLIDQNRRHVLTAIYDANFAGASGTSGARGDMRVNSSGDIYVCTVA